MKTFTTLLLTLGLCALTLPALALTGDVNCDGSKNVLDVVALVADVLGNETLGPCDTDDTPNCFLMGFCGGEGAGQYEIDGPYTTYSLEDAASVGDACVWEFYDGATMWDSQSPVQEPYLYHACL